MPTREDLVYRALRSAAGKGGAADSEDGIEALIRRVRSRAIAAVDDMAERAALQAFPDHATDLLPYYERLVGLTDDPDLTLEERQAAAAALYALQMASDIPSIERELSKIDPRFSVVTASHERSITTIAGRAFQDFYETMPFGGGRQSTGLPSFAGKLILRVLLSLGNGVAPNADERRKMKLARRVLHDILPATNDLQIATHRGFTLDVSKLDLTSLTP
jgi:Uncharacterised protein conserved in bacteria (DUF2313)